MGASAEETKRELIAQLASRARERAGETHAAGLEAFVAAFYADGSPRELAEAQPDDLYGAAFAIWRFLQQRELGVANVRVYNPRIDDSGWQSSHTVIEIINDDMPFLIDSIIAELHRLEIGVATLAHPIVGVKRDEDGSLLALDDGDGSPRESLVQIQVSEQPVEEHAALKENLERVLRDVRLSVADWGQMLIEAEQVKLDLKEHPPQLSEAEIDETVELLDWMCDGRFTFLGYRRYVFEAGADEMQVTLDPKSGLGLLRDPKIKVFGGLRGAELTEEQSEFLRQKTLLRITQTLRRSTVHRGVSLDTVAVSVFDKAGEVIGAKLFVGLFTYEAFADSPLEIPGLRRRVAWVLEQSKFPPGSHSARQLQHVLDSYPRTELFQTSQEELLEIAMGILHLQDRQKTALFVRQDPFKRFVSCLVYLPRDRYDTPNRMRISKILEGAYQGEIDRFYTHLSDSPLARLHFIIKTPLRSGYAAPREEVERKLVEAVRAWEDRLAEALIDEHGEANGMALSRRYGEAFPAGYPSFYNEHMALIDIERMEEALDNGGLAMNLYRPVDAEPHELNFKIYVAGRRAQLSDVLPILENLGLRVIDERLFEVRPADRDQCIWIRDFSMVTEGKKAIGLSDVRASFHEIFSRVWAGEMENDSLNKLVAVGGLQPREVTVVRAYSKYLRQTRIPFSQGYMRETLTNHPDVTRALIDLFMELFDPEVGESAESSAKKMTRLIERRLETVSSLDEDRILRRFLNAIRSTLRTNYFQTDSEGNPKPYLAMKIDSRAIDELPLPRPYREIHVHSPRMEAIHLRGGPVARGGIRWSDRREDFRTEILGLMKAQMVKNAVIVPVGSKGGFVVRRPPEEREELQREVRECYQVMMRGLLDVTDNLDGDHVVPPPSVVRRDGDDPYLVVAADKGTATFSDIANGIAGEYGFWLDDAFASGGSAGYDHKKMGITARGAWESVKRHFRELGKNTQTEDFKVVGVGDMSGDVFGNGMLLSPHIHLVAAFNHLHIFLDPNPDAVVGLAERRRLFDLPRSSWADYNPELISAGGGVIDRQAKSVDTTEEMRELLGIEEETLRPSELIQAILACEVDLLWFGGIGTYVKASAETDADADDRSNDSVRVDATSIRAAVIGEGANLGVTQRGRIELGLQGVCLNTDSIDNSAGVDTSDHEVNIKVLLREVEAAGDMTRKQRDELLQQMTDEVAALVLRDNYLQTQAISVTGQLGARLNDRHGRFMGALEKKGRLDREIEYLPEVDELADRSSHGLGLTRSELAVLLSYAKLDLYQELLSSDVPDDPFMTAELERYFPEPIRERFPEAISSHRLRREIVATVLTNSLINRVGIAFIHEVRERTGMSTADIVRAFVVSREVFDLRDLWQEIESLDNQIPASVQASMLAECGRTLERATAWFLRLPDVSGDIGRRIGEYREGVNEIANEIADLTSESEVEEIAKRTRYFVEHGASEALAGRVVRLQSLAPACDIVRLARSGGRPSAGVAVLYFAVGARFGFNFVRRAALGLPADTAWDKLAVNAILDDLAGHQTSLTDRVMAESSNGRPDPAAVEAWAAERGAMVSRSEQLIAELQSVAQPTLAMLAVANRQLKTLSE